MQLVAVTMLRAWKIWRAGDIAGFLPAQAKELIEEGFAKAYPEPKPEPDSKPLSAQAAPEKKEADMKPLARRGRPPRYAVK